MKVSCYAGYRGEETPRRFTLETGGPGSGRREVEVVAVEARWREPGWRAFRVCGDDDRTYELRQDVESGRWELRALERARTW